MFVSNMPDDQQQSASQGAVPPIGGAPVSLSPASGVVSAGGPSAPGSTNGPATPAGGQFASLNQYLTANQGQAMPLANKLTSGIGRQYNDLAAQNTATLGGIDTQVSAGAAPSQAATNATIAQESANPASFTSTPGNVASFQGLLNAAYSGPASAEGTSGYANQQNTINQAIAQGQANTATEAGRENLISQNEAKAATSTTALNSAILSQDPNALSSVENAYKPFQNLVTGLQSGAAATDRQIAANQAQAAQTKQAAQDAITSQITALNTGVTGELTAAQKNAAAQNARVRADLAAGTPSAGDLQVLGITADQWNSLSSADKAAATSQLVKSNQGQFGAQSGTATMDPTQFLVQQDPNAVFSAANVATPDDYAKAQAFQALLQGMNFAAPTAIINPATSAQAGTAPTNTNQFDYQTALNTATSTKADEVAAAQAYVDALQSGADENHAQLAAQQAGRQSLEQKLMPVVNTTIGAPITLASQIPVIGKPIANAVDTVVQAVSSATWICTAMRKAGVMTDIEIKNLHDHLYKAAPYKPWSFIKYIMLGKPAVILANIAHVTWHLWKPIFYDIPMSEPNPILAVEMYEAAFWTLVRTALCKILLKEFLPQ